LIDQKGEQKEETFLVPENIQRPMIDKVVRYFLNDGPNPCPAGDGVEVMRIIDVFSNG
jgi:hypothetical protein